MLEVFNETGLKGWLANVGGAFLVLFAIAGLVFGLGLPRLTEAVNPRFAPPTWVITVAWFVLFILNGAARWSLNGIDGRLAGRLKSCLVAIFLVNATHPLSTAGFRLSGMAFAGTMVSLGLTLYVVARAWPIRRSTSLLMIPMVAWLGLATCIIVAVLGRNGGV